MLKSLTGLSILLVLFSSISASLSVWIQRGHIPQWTVAISAMVPALIWSYMSKLDNHSMAKLSITYDVIAVSVWNLVFLAWGIKFTFKEVAALALHIIAISLVLL